MHWGKRRKNGRGREKKYRRAKPISFLFGRLFFAFFPHCGIWSQARNCYQKRFLHLKGIKNSLSRLYDKSGEFCCDFCAICCSFYHPRTQLVAQQFDYWQQFVLESTVEAPCSSLRNRHATDWRTILAWRNACKVGKTSNTDSNNNAAGFHWCPHNGTFTLKSPEDSTV